MSFIEWPIIYGSAYFLPGIIVVVLLLALLLLFVSRRRARAEGQRAAAQPAIEAEAATESPAPMEPPVESKSLGGPAVVTQPVATMTQPFTVSRVPEATAVPGPGVAPGSAAVLGPGVAAGSAAVPSRMPTLQPLGGPQLTPRSTPESTPPSATQSVPQSAPLSAAQSMPQPELTVHQPFVPPRFTLVPPPTVPILSATSIPGASAEATADIPTEAEPEQVSVAEALDPTDPVDEPETHPEAEAPAAEPRRGRRVKPHRHLQAPGATGSDPAPRVHLAAPLTTDPLALTIADILTGWGDLTTEDMKRVELFRPDRLSGALAAIQLPKSKSTDAKLRLTQLRQYAAGLELREVDDQVVAAAAAATAEPLGAIDSTPMQEPLGAIASRPMQGAMPDTAPTVLSEGMRDVTPALTPTTTPAEPRPVAFTSPATRSFYDDISASALPSDDVRPEAEAETRLPAEPEGWSPAEPETGKTGFAGEDPPSFWSDPRPVWEPDPEPMYEAIQTPAYDEIEIASATSSDPAGDDASGSDNGHKPTSSRGIRLDTSALSAALNIPMGPLPAYESPMAPSADAFVLPDEDPPTSADASPDVSPDAFVAPSAGASAVPPVVGSSPPVAAARPAESNPPRDVSFWDDNLPALSRLAVRVETAEQLLALPPDERIDLAALLPPAELAATFRATRDSELKRAVIDTLERIGTPASLNALGNCFEDPDPEMQIYALAAADRLLGAA